MQITLHQAIPDSERRIPGIQAIFKSIGSNKNTHY